MEYNFNLCIFSGDIRTVHNVTSSKLIRLQELHWVCTLVRGKTHGVVNVKCKQHTNWAIIGLESLESYVIPFDL